jgi:hypothetical protein
MARRMKLLKIVFLTLALALAACGRDEAPMKGAAPSAGTKGPGAVDRGGGKGEGATVGESQNRDTKSGGATSGSK